MRAPFQIHLARRRYKFSCSHMTVFPDGTKERLHGHNYFVEIRLDLSDISFENLIPFGRIKEILAEQCLAWKERTMVAAKNPFFEKISETEEDYEFRLCGKRYVLPTEDVLVLPVDNISVEQLAAHLGGLLISRFKGVIPTQVVGMTVTVSEVPGQGASAYLSLTE